MDIHWSYSAICSSQLPGEQIKNEETNPGYHFLRADLYTTALQFFYEQLIKYERSEKNE